MTTFTLKCHKPGIQGPDKRVNVRITYIFKASVGTQNGAGVPFLSLLTDKSFQQTNNDFSSWSCTVKYINAKQHPILSGTLTEECADAPWLKNSVSSAKPHEFASAASSAIDLIPFARTGFVCIWECKPALTNADSLQKVKTEKQLVRQRRNRNRISFRVRPGSTLGQKTKHWRCHASYSLHVICILCFSN